MPEYITPVSRTITAEELPKIVAAGKDDRERAILALLWLTGARPAELLALTLDSIQLQAEDFRVIIPTLKLHTEEGGRFWSRARQLLIKRGGPEAEAFLRWYIVARDARVPDSSGPMFGWSPEGRAGVRQLQRLVTRASRAALGMKLSPYHFRHSRLTQLAYAGKNVAQLQHFKGAKDVRSVSPYLHATPFSVE